MCIGFWSLDHPEYALILCSNRDEYLARPTTPAHFHSFEMPVERDVVPEPTPADAPSSSAGSHAAPHGSVLSGRDLRAGGTWLGISRAGRLAFLTNITEDRGPFSSSRGALTSSFLLPDPDTDAETPRAYAEHLVRAGGDYAGFNLLLLAPAAAHDGRGLAFDAAFVTNSGGGGPLTTRALTPAERRCGALSNGVDGRGADAWPKVRIGTALFADVLAGLDEAPPDTAATAAGEMALVERLFGLLSWQSPAPPLARADLKNTIQIPPLHVRADALAAADAPPPFYGTRASSAVLVRRDGAALFVERDVWTLGAGGGVVRGDAGRQRVFRFQVQVPG